MSTDTNLVIAVVSEVLKNRARRTKKLCRESGIENTEQERVLITQMLLLAQDLDNAFYKNIVALHENVFIEAVRASATE